ncbi:hypothetical protein LIER_35560 [Lithospermum erythrorhizon]|uniref:Ubiquitin-like domain-containing protein n=1 Tax=Lithospermum erythrorhizon TaxID=34254 RepID=A0AAV3NSG6_LITER
MLLRIRLLCEFGECGDGKSENGQTLLIPCWSLAASIQKLLRREFPPDAARLALHQGEELGPPHLVLWPHGGSTIL